MSELPRWETYAGITVGVHVNAGTPLEFTLYPEDGRVVLHVYGRNGATLHLFLRRADLGRLLDVASAAGEALGAAVAALPHADTEPDTDTGHGSDDDPTGVTAAA